MKEFICPYCNSDSGIQKIYPAQYANDIVDVFFDDNQDLYVQTADKEPTFSAAGQKTYVICKMCGYRLSKEEIKRLINNYEQQEDYPTTVLSDQELEEIVARMILQDEIDDGEQYEKFLEDLSKVLCKHCGGVLKKVKPPNHKNPNYMVKIQWDECVPEDGGIWEDVQPDYTQIK